MRVHELAKELGLSSKALMDLLAAMKIPAKSHSSTLDEAAIDRVRRHVKTKGKTAPVDAPTAPVPGRDAKTPTGERILGMRKITPPPPPPVVEAVPIQAATAVEAVEPPAKPTSPDLVPPKPAAPKVPATGAEQAPKFKPGVPKEPLPPSPPKFVPRGARPVPPRRAMPTPPPQRVVPADLIRKEAPVTPGLPAAPSAGTMPMPSPIAPPAAPITPRERKTRERIPPPPPDLPAPPPIVPAEIELSGALAVGDLATKLGLSGGDLVKRLLEQGVLAGINQQIPVEIATKAAESFGATVQKPGLVDQAAAAPTRMEFAKDGAAVPRPPVVTIMGHVDHGKTSLLDAIRQTNVAEQEVGGITQHIGASVVELNGRRIVFIDTPGHEAFTTLRARGAQVTDIVVLVVAAEDGVMPQTTEAYNHAKAAGVPIIVAINKVDLPQANPDRVKQQLAELGLTPEEWGGDTVTVAVSARSKQGVKELLEMILLVADLHELHASPDRPGRGTILEARLDKGRGPVATILVQEGTIRIGDAIVAGETYGRVRAMTDARGQRVAEAPPSTPVEVVGLDDVPQAGTFLEVVRDDRLAKAVGEGRYERRRAVDLATVRPGAAEEVATASGGLKELRLIIKADAHGSVEAVAAAVSRLGSAEVGVSVLQAAVGNVTESDVMLAAASQAVILGFNVRPDPQVRKLAEQEHVEILSYRLIYEAIDHFRTRLRGLLAPIRREVSLGQAEVRQIFNISKVGTVAGCYVTAGAIPRSATLRVIRDGVVIHEGKLASLRRFKEDVREVAEGFECGIGLERFNDVKVGDLLEAFEVREEPA